MPSVTSRSPLSRDRVIAAAVAVADADGLSALTMRSLATSLGVKPMSVYHYFSGKDEILDALVDVVFAEIEVPTDREDWQDAMRHRAHSAREALRRHPWVLPLMESRLHAGPATLGHHDAVLGVLLDAGFPMPETAHAYSVLDAYVYGFALQEAALPFEGSEEAANVAKEMTAAFADGAYPHLVAFSMQHVLQPGYDYGAEFDFGLELILAALERRRHIPLGVRREY